MRKRRSLLDTRGKFIFSIREALDSYLSRHRNLAYKIKSIDAVKLWETVVDEYIGRHTKATVCKERTLFVNTESTALANELSLKEKELIEKMNRGLKYPLIERIVFKSGFIAQREFPKDRKDKIDKKLNIHLLNEIEKTVSVIEEDELRSILKRFLVASAKRPHRT
ncbi:MAG: hypothetical protein AMS17_01415 [Spirochaetes bacterium DG_61]|jgi:hypothetical protein|nr:MAG: hypothetical protein AMS17_01415 [Spirochaetes bacterium DG_61]